MSRLSIDIYGVDTSKLNWKEEMQVREMTKKRWELEAIKEKRFPKPQPKLSRREELERKKILLRLAQIEKELKEMDEEAERQEKELYRKGGQ